MSTDCTQAELEKAADPNNHFTCLTRGVSVGFFAATLAPLASFVALIWLFTKIYTNARSARRSQKHRLINSPIELYLLSLFTGDLIESFGESLNLRWIILGKVQPDSFCKAQGFILTVGETAMALTCSVIAVHTFVTVWWGRCPRSLLVPCIVITMLWMFDLLFPLILLVSTPNRRHELFTPSPYWCWYPLKSDMGFKLATFYVWLWLGILLSFVCYVPLVWLRWGSSTVNLYPIALSIVGIPLSVTRWRSFANKNANITAWETLIGAFVFDLSGLINVLLFVYTRHGLFLPREAQIPHLPESALVGNDYYRQRLAGLG